MSGRPILIAAATRLEIEPILSRLEDPGPLPLPYGEGLGGSCASMEVAVAWFGIGKVNTAAGLALALERLRPSAVVQVGIGGLFRGWEPARPDMDARARPGPGTAAIASDEVHMDLGVRTDAGFSDLEELGFPLLDDRRLAGNRLPVSPALTEQLAAGRYPLVPFGTSETVTGSVRAAAQLETRWGVAVESMEGAAAAQVCLAQGVPFGEVRGISNLVGERDKSRWLLGEAIVSASTVLTEWLERGAPQDAASVP